MTDGDPRTGSPAVGAPRRTTWLPAIVGFALLMQTLDATVIANALPSMARDLGKDPLQLNLAITAYLLAVSVFLPVSGWMADRFGARQVFASAIALFAVSSVGCAMATGIGPLVVARIAQGAAASMMTPVGRLILLQNEPKETLARAMSFLIMPGIVGTVLGPPLGGLIVTYASWRWIFLINVPMGVIGVVLARRFVPRGLRDVTRDFDLFGFVLAGSGLALLIFGLENLGRTVMSGVASGSLIGVGALLLAGYVVHGRRIAHPLLDLSLLRGRLFRDATVGGMLTRMSAGASPFLLALLLQLGFGLTPLMAGLLTVAEATGSLSMVRAAQALIHRYGYLAVLTGSTALMSLALLGYAAIRPATPIWVILPVLFCGGMTRSVLFTTLNAVAFLQIEPRDMSRASSLSAVFQQVAVSFGVGSAAALLSWLRGGQPHDQEIAAAISPIFIALALCSAVALLFMRNVPRQSELGVRTTARSGREISRMGASLDAEC